MKTIQVKFPDNSISLVPFEQIARDTGRGLHGEEYLECVAKDQANGAPPCPAEKLGDEVVLC